MQGVGSKQSEHEDSDGLQTRLAELTDALSAADRAAGEYSSTAVENLGLIRDYYLKVDEPSSLWIEKKVAQFVETEMKLPVLYQQFDRQRTRYREVFEAFKRDYLDDDAGGVVE
jgi:hypothetical protein